MTFEEWWKKEGLTNRDEADCGYFSKNDMMWIAELSWNAAVRTMMDQERKTKNTQEAADVD